MTENWLISRFSLHTDAVTYFIKVFTLFNLVYLSLLCVQAYLSAPLFSEPFSKYLETDACYSCSTLYVPLLIRIPRNMIYFGYLSIF